MAVSNHDQPTLHIKYPCSFKLDYTTMYISRQEILKEACGSIQFFESSELMTFFFLIQFFNGGRF